MRRIAGLLAAVAGIGIGGCSGTRDAAPVGEPATPLTVKIIAFNDFHGALETPGRPIDLTAPDGSAAKVSAGGAAYFASAVKSLKAANPHNVVVAAGDLTSASPLVSSLFLDEPTVKALNMAGLEINAAGNHEFDRGLDELKRLQSGGCKPFTTSKPCQIEPFEGADYAYLAGNSVTADGASVLPGTRVKTFGSGRDAVTIGFIGVTTRLTGSYVDPAGIPGVTFADEAVTANRLARELKAKGAHAVVLLVHEGGYPARTDQPDKCEGLSGPIVDIVQRLDPVVDVIVSGHSHRSYICDYGPTDPARPVLLTSAGNNGAMLTDIDLRFDPVTKRVIARSARQVIVQGDGATSAAGPVKTVAAFPTFPADPAVAAHVARYVEAAAPRAKRVVGRIAGPLVWDKDVTKETTIGLAVADAQLAATRASGAQIALMNPGGVRAGIDPGDGGTVTFGDLFTVQPFGNNLMVKEMTGAQIRVVLEQQFTREGGAMVLFPAGMTFDFDQSRPRGQRVLNPRVDGQPMRDDAAYRVAVNSFLAGGGDGFTGFTAGRDIAGGMLDLTAMEAWFAGGNVVAVPVPGRVRNLTPPQ